MSHIIPRDNNNLLAFTLNLEKQFPEISPGFGYTTAQLDAIVNASQWVRYVILKSQAGAAFSKATTAYKNGMLYGFKDGAPASPNPEFTDSTAPAGTPEPDLIGFLSNELQALKLKPGYTEAIGEQLMIHTETPDSAIPPDAKPSAAATAMVGSIVRIDWMKGKFDGVFIESQRGDETEWTRLGFDMRSPYEDTRPPLSAGKPEERRYRLIYFMDNTAVGIYSDIISIITMP